MHIISLQDYGELGVELHDDVPTTNHLVSSTILLNATVQSTTSSRLLNVLLDMRGTSTTINE